jgi:D-alanyl-D-alanine carboxypeptidase
MSSTAAAARLSRISKLRPISFTASFFILIVWAFGVLTLHAGYANAANHHHHHNHKSAGKTRRAGSKPRVPAKPIYESIVMDANTGRILHQSNANTRAYPASLTKMMTLYMLFDALQKGKVHLDTAIKVSRHAASQAPTKLYLVPGSTITVEQAIYAMVTKSANDVAVAVAEHLGGSEKRFCARMTARAHAIGMARTQFRNASGLPNRGQLSTARDMAILGKRLMTEFPQYFHYFSQREFSFHGKKIRGHNHLLGNYDGADGIKTGYTAASGFNLVASARRGNSRLITVVFGGRSVKSRDQHAMALMDAGFNVLNSEHAIVTARSSDPSPAKEEASLARLVPQEVPAATSIELADASPEAVQDGVVIESAGDIDDDDSAPVPPTTSRVAAVLVPPSATADVQTKKITKTPAFSKAHPEWGIQVGAYHKRAVAKKQAAKAWGKVRTRFAAAATRVERIKRNNHVLYRAQVIGLDRKEVATACRLVAKTVHTDCKWVPPDRISH